MATTIQNLHSLTAGNQPGDLLAGEVAYNVADGFVYLGNGSNVYTDTLGQTIGPSSQPGGGWQQGIFNAAPIPGAVTLAGIYDAIDNEVTSVTAAGTAAGFTVGPLPASAAGNTDYYVIVQIGGTLTPPAPTGDADPGDWLVSTGSGWALVQNSNVTIPASNVTVVPSGDLTGPDLQTVLSVQIPLNYVNQATGVVSQLNCNGDAEVYGSTTLGDADTDDLTVNATSAFAAPVSMAETLNVTGQISGANGCFISGNLRTTNNLIVDNNTTLGNSATDTVAITGPATLQNNLTVAGVTQLNGASQINGGLTTTGTVALTGTGGVTLSTPFNTTGNITVTIGQSTDVVVNSADCRFTGGSVTSIVGTLSLNGAVNGNPITYTRPLTGTSGALVAGPLPQFLVVPGTIITFAGTTAPAGYLPCDGRSLANNSTYADLFSAIGYTWGGSGGNFNLPDLRGLFLRGSGTNATQKMSNNQFATAGLVGTTWADTVGSHNHVLKLNTLGYAGTQFGGQRECLSPATSQMTSSGKPNNGTLDVNYGGDPGSAAIQNNANNVQTQPVQGIVLYCIKF